jgi:CelD/BcsL family acetyltransferase involved in cellulose biosynthesis
LHREEEIRPLLSLFIAQHIRRWSETPFPSLFLDARQRDFYTCVIGQAATTGCLRLSCLQVDEEAVAFHLGACVDGTFLWYKPSFDINWSRYSPGEVLLRQLLLYAAEIGAHTFDFGLGDEPFKKRFATQVRFVRTWGLYPRELESQGVII